MEKSINKLDPKSHLPINDVEIGVTGAGVNKHYGDGSAVNEVVVKRGAEYVTTKETGIASAEWHWVEHSYRNVKPASLVRVFWLQMKLLEKKP
jgi:hypothetical protein